MGQKITVDSATLANKALEVIEAHYLFGLPYDALDVVVHPQSIIHAFVEFCDGSVIAQLGFPSMELPILYALTHPGRLPDTGVRRLDPVAAGPFTFEPVRRDVFRALGAGMAAGRAAGTAPAVFNAANEVAVAAFLDGAIPFGRISEIIEQVLDAHLPAPATAVEAVREADRWARARARELVRTLVLTTILALIVVLGVLIFIHEAGHFLAAKWAGIYVHRFSLGLGSPIPWLTFRRGETEYSISWLPLGGYVKMASIEEDVTSSALEGGHVEAAVPPDRVFEAKPVWKRMIVILAGVTMNALFAWMAFSFLAAKNGRQIDPVDHRGARHRGDDSARGARRCARSRSGSRITSINGRPVTSWNDVTDGIANAPEPEIRIDLDGGRSVVLPIHQDALEQRLKASQALQPFRPAVVGQVLPGRPAARAGFQAGDTIVAINGKAIAQWYDVLEVLQGNGGTPLAIEVAGATGRRTLQVRPDVETVEGLDGKPRQVGRVGISVQLDFRSEPLGVGRGAGRRLQRHGGRVDPDRAHGPRALQRPDLPARGGRPDHDRPAGRGERPDGSGPLPRLHGADLDQPGDPEPAAGPGPGRRPAHLPAGRGGDPASAPAQAPGAAHRGGNGADRAADGAGVQQRYPAAVRRGERARSRQPLHRGPQTGLFFTATTDYGNGGTSLGMAA